MENEKEPVSIRYIDKDLYKKLSDIAKIKGCVSDKKIDIFNFIFNDYINMHELDEFKNPYLIKAIREIITSSVNDSERKLGGRLFKLTAEMGINLSVLNQVIYANMNKFGDDEESIRELHKYRETAIEELRENKLYPLSYVKLVKEEDDS